MILLDANVLLYGVRRDLEHHEVTRTWLVGAIENQGVVLADQVVVSVVRLATDARVFATPSRPEEIVTFVESLRRRRGVHALRTSDRHQRQFLDLCRQMQYSGNDIPDVYLAALALAERCPLASADRGFARFPGLHWVNPLEAA